jgi:hypothetical protein
MTTDYIATNDTETATGAICYWRVQPCDADALKAAWDGQGLPLDMLPSGRRDHIVLREVARAVAGKLSRVTVDSDGDEIGHIVRDLAEKHGCVIVRDRATTADVEKDATVIRVRFARHCPGYGADSDGLVIDGPQAEAWREQIRADYSNARGMVQTTPISTMLSVRVSAMLDAVSLRNGGGVYFVPRHALATLDRVKAALGAVGCKVYALPAMSSADAVESVLDALQAESDVLISNMEDGLIESDLGPRACQGKAKECDAHLEKLEKYESLLGCKLESIRDRIASLSSDYTAAALEALADI